MKYEIKIDKAKEAKGKISLQRIALIADSIRKVAEGALQIRLRGVSITKGRKKFNLEDALDITLAGLRGGSTCLDLETTTFAETLEPVQLDVFRQEAQKDLPQQTPVSLFMKAFEEAVKDNPSADLLDKPLLKELKNLKKAFFSNEETMIISNEGTVEQITITHETFAKIKILEEEIPNSQPVIINGKVELLRFSQQKAVIETEEGMVEGFLGEAVEPSHIASFFGREITIAGTAHYKPGGKSVIEIERISEPATGDAFFSKKPRTETVEQQIQRQVKEGKQPNNLEEMQGLWKEETYEELAELLRK
ncbi:MAG: hypothetical protein SFU87_05095 [Chitinophagaceae bacterium]|nr:hypothetical protein [Chitinophagaceae bacterium]